MLGPHTSFATLLRERYGVVPEVLGELTHGTSRLLLVASLEHLTNPTHFAALPVPLRLSMVLAAALAQDNLYFGALLLYALAARYGVEVSLLQEATKYVKSARPALGKTLARQPDAAHFPLVHSFKQAGWGLSMAEALLSGVQASLRSNNVHRFAEGKVERAEPAVRLPECVARKLVSIYSPGQAYSFGQIYGTYAVVDLYTFYFPPGSFEPEVSAFLDAH